MLVLLLAIQATNLILFLVTPPLELLIPKIILDVVYNYGAFDFRTPNFVAKFAKGDLQYFAIAHSFTDFMDEYTYEKRSVFEQELIISLHYKQKLFDNLNNTIASEERYYTYKFIDQKLHFDGC